MSHAARKIQPVPAPQTALGSHEPEALISSTWDVLLIGGASLVLLALMSVAFSPDPPDDSVGWFVFNLSFIANFPHFLVSYQMLYTDYRREIFKSARFFWAAVAVPSLLAGLLIYGFASTNISQLGYLVNAMFFFVGWHYVKQIFGGITVSNALQNFHYNAGERLALKANLFSLWAISFLIPNIGEQNYLMDGIPYSSLQLPPVLLHVAFLSLTVSGLSFVYLNVKKYIEGGRLPSRTAMICFLSIYAWYLPALSHPAFMHLIPFFHSVQYLIFVYAFRRNKVEAHIEKPHTPQGRQARVIGLWGYLLIPCFTGGFLMYVLPRYLDAYQILDVQKFGPTPMYFAFVLFINVHHYFIDNVLWRGSNEQIKKYLFRKQAS